MANGPRRERKPKGVALVTDVDDGAKAAYDLPSPSKAGVVNDGKDQNGNPIKDADGVEEEEDMADKVGWNQRYGWPVESVLAGDSMLDHSTWLETKMPDAFFGGNSPYPTPSLRLYLVPRSDHFSC